MRAVTEQGFIEMQVNDVRKADPRRPRLFRPIARGPGSGGAKMEGNPRCRLT